MTTLTILFTMLFSLGATGIMSYIAMATPIGPWIETTIVLMSIFVFHSFGRSKKLTHYLPFVTLTTAAAGIGGIMATGFSFSIPALAITDKALFTSWLATPLYFSLFFALFALVSAGFGFIAANLFEEQLLIREQLPFPISELIYKTIATHNKLRQAYELVAGLVGTVLLFGLTRYYALISPLKTLFEGWSWSFITLPKIVIPLEQTPLYLAIGFVSGETIAKPLIAGFLLKIIIMDALFYGYHHAPAHSLLNTLFPHPVMNNLEFALAFCSGLILYGVLASFIKLAQKTAKAGNIFPLKNSTLRSSSALLFGLSSTSWIGMIALTGMIMAFFFYLKLSFIAQVYLLFFTLVCIYQLAIIAGRIGVAPLGRFATFIMVPAMLLFNISSLQAIIIAAFVEIAGGVATDVLFGRKLALLSAIDKKTMKKFQWLGLITSCLAIGVIFWFLASTIGLGGCALPITKAVNRALLINAQHFDTIIVLIGLLFGYFLTFTGINPTLILGGILMPPAASLLLIIGGLLPRLVGNKDAYYPLFSGISAGNILWILGQALFDFWHCPL